MLNGKFHGTKLEEVMGYRRNKKRWLIKIVIQNNIERLYTYMIDPITFDDLDSIHLYFRALVCLRFDYFRHSLFFDKKSHEKLNV